LRSWGGVSVGGFDVGGRGEVGDGHEDEDEGEGEGLRGRLWEVGLFRFARALRVVEVGFLEGVVLRFRREGVVDAGGYDYEIDIESEGEGGEGEGRKVGGGAESSERLAHLCAASRVGRREAAGCTLG